MLLWEQGDLGQFVWRTKGPLSMRSDTSTGLLGQVGELPEMLRKRQDGPVAFVNWSDPVQSASAGEEGKAIRPPRRKQTAGRPIRAGIFVGDMAMARRR